MKLPLLTRATSASGPGFLCLQSLGNIAFGTKERSSFTTSQPVYWSYAVMSWMPRTFTIRISLASTVPVPVDVELIFYSVYSGSAREDRGGVLASGLLPYSPGITSVKRYDLSGLGCNHEHETPFRRRPAFRPDDPDWSSIKVPVMARPRQNLVMRSDGSVVDVRHYSEFVCRGFLFGSQ